MKVDDLINKEFILKKASITIPISEYSIIINTLCNSFRKYYPDINQNTNLITMFSSSNAINIICSKCKTFLKNNLDITTQGFCPYCDGKIIKLIFNPTPISEKIRLCCKICGRYNRLGYWICNNCGYIEWSKIVIVGLVSLMFLVIALLLLILCLDSFSVQKTIPMQGIIFTVGFGLLGGIPFSFIIYSIVNALKANNIENMIKKKDIDSLIKALNYKQKWEERQKIAKTLGEIGEQKVIEPLIQALSDEHSYVKREAIRALGKIGEQKAVEPLIEMLTDKNSLIRKEAIEILGNIGNITIIEHIIQCFQDEEISVREKAIKIFDKLSASLNLEGSLFPLFSQEQSFFDECSKSGQASIIFLFCNFSSIFKKGLESKVIDGDIRILCAKCLIDMPMSFKFTLVGIPTEKMIVFGNIPNNTFDSAKSGKCPYCNSSQGILLWDNPNYGEITEEDMKALRKLWRFRCQLWWEQNKRSEGRCDRCNCAMNPQEGYHLGSRVVCEKCIMEYTSSSELKKNPNYFGMSELHRARNFKAGLWRFEQCTFSSRNKDIQIKAQEQVLDNISEKLPIVDDITFATPQSSEKVSEKMLDLPPKEVTDRKNCHFCKRKIIPVNNDSTSVTVYMTKIVEVTPSFLQQSQIKYEKVSVIVPRCTTCKNIHKLSQSITITYIMSVVIGFILSIIISGILHGGLFLFFLSLIFFVGIGIVKARLIWEKRELDTIPILKGLQECPEIQTLLMAGCTFGKGIGGLQTISHFDYKENP